MAGMTDTPTPSEAEFQSAAEAFHRVLGTVPSVLPMPPATEVEKIGVELLVKLHECALAQKARDEIRKDPDAIPERISDAAYRFRELEAKAQELITNYMTAVQKESS